MGRSFGGSDVQGECTVYIYCVVSHLRHLSLAGEGAKNPFAEKAQDFRGQLGIPAVPAELLSEQLL